MLTGGEWQPALLNHRFPTYTQSVREQRLPGGPVKAERSVVHNVLNIQSGVPIPLLGDPRPSPVAAGPPPQQQGPPPLSLMLSPQASLPQITMAANRLHSPNNPAIVLVAEGAAAWTDEQIVREVIAGSWGLAPSLSLPGA